METKFCLYAIGKCRYHVFSSNLFRDLAAISQDYSEVTIPIYLYANKFKTKRNDNERKSAFIYQWLI